MARCILNLTGSVAAPATLWRAGRIYEPALAHLVERQIARGTAALVVGGSSGEAAALSPAEHSRLIAFVVTLARPVPVIAGCTSTATEASAGLARDVEAFRCATAASLSSGSLLLGSRS